MFNCNTSKNRLFLIRKECLVYCTGVLRYSTISQVPTDLSSFPVPSLANEEDLRLSSFNNPYETLLAIDQMPRRSAHKEIYLRSFESPTLTPDGFSLRWVINNGSLDELRLKNLTQPLLFDLYNDIKENLPNNVIYSINQNQLVDIVFQNTTASQGTGQYNSSKKPTPNTNSPVLCDTVILYASSYLHPTSNRTLENYLKPCGWVKIRLIADNPGLWLLHYHIGAHTFIGMSVLIKEDTEHLVMNYMPQN